jgi:SOS response regulatory protein OraA/RecX
LARDQIIAKKELDKEMGRRHYVRRLGNKLMTALLRRGFEGGA